MSKRKEEAVIISQECLCAGVYSMWIETAIAKEAIPGQFISVYTKDASKLLPRPISICETEDDKIRIVYRTVGEGTKEFSSYSKGDTVTILGPLGNGFLDTDYERPLLIGGGIGIPPMLGLAKKLTGKKSIVAGYRNAKETFLASELKDAGTLYVATDDGSLGTNGTVIDAIWENQIDADVIFACGPKPMLKAVKEYAMLKGIKAYISMEERMACGIGACLGCVCKSSKKDDHSQVKNKRVCKDGPVFEASEVEL